MSEVLTESDQTPPQRARRLSWPMRLGSVAWGFVCAVAGAVLGVGLTWAHVEQSTDDYAGLIGLVLLPAGYLLGGILGSGLVWIGVPGRPRHAQGAKAGYAMLGVVGVPVLVIGFILSLNALDQARLGAGDRTDTTRAEAEMVIDATFPGGFWYSNSSLNARHDRCAGQLSKTDRRLDALVSATDLGPAMQRAQSIVEQNGFAVRHAVLVEPDGVERLRFVAHKDEALIDVVANRSNFTGKIKVVAYAGDCVESLGFGLVDVPHQVTTDEWSSRLSTRFTGPERLADTYQLLSSSADQAERELILREPVGSWLCDQGNSFWLPGPASRVIEEGEAASAAAYDWYSERHDLLVADGWQVQRQRLVLEERFPIDEQWLLWAVKDDIAVSIEVTFANRTQNDSYWAATTATIHVGSCIGQGHGPEEFWKWHAPARVQPMFDEAPSS